MEQSLSRIRIESRINGLRGSGRYDEEVLALVREDMEYGITEEQTGLYLKQGYNIGQMKILSKCLRDGISNDFIEILKENELSGPQMQVTLEFYEKGVAIENIREIVKRKEKPIEMNAAFQSILAKSKEVQVAAESETEYVKSLVARMEEVVNKIDYQDRRYDELNQKLSIFEASKSEEDVKEKLVKENEGMNQLVSDQQDKLNQANSLIAKLRGQIDEKDKEISKMKKQMDKPSISEEQPKESNPVAVQTPISVDTKTLYQAKLVDSQGAFLQYIPVEKTEKKSFCISGLLEKLKFFKKSRASIVKMVASGDLVPAQLVQIKIGMEKGLTENQLLELINNKVAADKMKEIIEIAVLENSMQG